MHDQAQYGGRAPDDATRVLDHASGVVGRAKEQGELDQLLARNVVVGVSGPPGVGKSRLAHAAARQWPSYAVCELSTARTVIDVWRALSEALGAGAVNHESDDALVARMLRAIREAEATLVVLDNVDGVQDFQAFVERLPGASSPVRFAATSRRRIDGPGVATLVLGGLEPADGRELFVLRARMVRPEFGTSPANLAAIDDLVTLVDGLPLAIELAASRTTVMGPVDLARRVAQRVDVLKSTSAQARHSSLRAALDESWAMLDDEQRACLSAWSVFAETFDLEAAEHVVAGLVPGDAADVIEALVASSLVHSAFVDTSLRFRMLRCVRDYAADQLTESTRREQVERLRDAYLLQRAERASQRMASDDGPAALADLQHFRDDYAEVVERFRSQMRIEELGRLLCALRWSILFVGPLAAFEDALRLVVDAAQTPEKVRALVAATLAEGLLLRGARIDAARVVEAVSVRVDPDGDPHGYLALRRLVAMVEAAKGPRHVHAVLEEAHTAARGHGDRFMEARLLERLGFAWTQMNEIDRAWLAFTEARETFRALGAVLFMSESATGLGYVELRLGRLDAAIERFDDAAQRHSNTPDSLQAASAFFNLGVALHYKGRLEEARGTIETALGIWTRAGFRRYVVLGMVRRGLIETETGELDTAWSTFSAAIQLARETNDHHNAAIAFVERAATDFSRGRPVDFERVEQMAHGILVGADPEAFASALTLLTAIASSRSMDSLGYVNRIEELASLFADDDTHARGVVQSLREVARAFHALSLARAADDEDVARQHVARAFEWAAGVLSDGGDARQASPFVRLWAERLRQEGGELAGFTPAGESFRGVLQIHRAGAWYRLDDRPPIDLSTRRPLRLIMARLAELAESDPGSGLDVDGLAAAGWPGEKIDLSTRRNRVYTAIRFLREMDLEDVLVTGPRGYGFASDVAVKFTDDSLPA